MTTYAQLQSDFPLWLKRSDINDQLPGFVALFESRLSRRLRVRKMETAFSGTIDSANKIALPSNWLAFKALWKTGAQRSTFKPQTLETVVSREKFSGTPAMYAIDGGSVCFDGSGDVSGVYYAAIPGLVANGANWLSVAAYDAYLFGVLSEAHLYSLSPQEAAVAGARSEAVLAEIDLTDKRDRFSGLITARAA